MARKNHRRITRRPAGRGRQAAPGRDLEKETLAALLRSHPEVLHVMEKHGVTFCAACYLTLFSPIGKVSGFHAVPDKKKFLADLRAAIR
ncbi:MAG TPA: hypothetical protein VNH15_06335 [Elusimicrobiota bacterium]|nr:hypothetical protein [Elusimicrobiota bacterium]